MNDTQHGGGGQPPSGPTFLGHPRGLATLFMTEFFERFTYYGMRALLVLFLVAATDGANPGFGIDRETAGAVYGLYTGGLRSHDATLTALMAKDALAVLTGPRVLAIPMPR